VHKFNSGEDPDKTLWLAYCEAGDYFSRLGGTGRYQSFSEHHVPTLVLVMALHKISNANEMDLLLKGILPFDMWDKTDELPETIREIISRLNIGSFSDLEGFIGFVDGEYQKHPYELKLWKRALREVDEYRQNMDGSCNHP
jgi:hypothetical protein